MESASDYIANIRFAIKGSDPVEYYNLDNFEDIVIRIFSRDGCLIASYSLVQRTEDYKSISKSDQSGEDIGKCSIKILRSDTIDLVDSGEILEAEFVFITNAGFESGFDDDKIHSIGRFKFPYMNQSNPLTKNTSAV